MKAKRAHYLFLILVMAGTGVLAFLWPRSKPAQISRLEEEQGIYSAILGDTLYHIEEETTLGLVSSDLEIRSTSSSFDCTLSMFTRTCTITGFSRQTTRVDIETVRDFKENNRQSYPIQNYLPYAKNYILVSANDIQHLPDSGWISLSRVGFNPTFTQALVLLGQSARINGSVDTCNEFYEILQKVNGAWVLQAKIQTVDCEVSPSQN